MEAGQKDALARIGVYQEKVQQIKSYLETKIDGLKLIEDFVNQNKKEVHRVQELHLRSKEEFQQLYYEMKRDFDRYSERHDLHEVRMD